MVSIFRPNRLRRATPSSSASMEFEAQPFAKERFVRRNVFHPQIFKLKGGDNQLLNL